MTNRKTLTCERCGRRSIVGLSADDWQSWPAGAEASLILRPSDHLRDAFLVVCVSCLRETWLRQKDLEAGGPICHSCRKATRDNWWASAYAGNRNPPLPQKIVCPACKSVRYGPRNVASAEYAISWACTGLVPDPKQGPRLSLEIPRLTDIKDCCNYIIDDKACIVRAAGPCIVLEGHRCGWYEKAVRPAGRLSGRVCATCGGEIPKRRRFCDACRKARRRTAYRESKRRKRVLCPQLTAPTPPNCQEFEAV